MSAKIRHKFQQIGRYSRSNRHDSVSDSIHDVSPNAWMLTFSDLLTLLLTLFVMRLSMSSLDTAEITKKLKALKTSVSTEQKDIIKTGGNNLMPRIEIQQPSELKNKTELTALVANGLGKTLGVPRIEAKPGSGLKFPSDISLSSTENSTTLLLGASTFLSGSDIPSFKAKDAVIAISKILALKNVEITVAGHTDNMSINNAQFASNWELSTARAIAVARQMIDTGVNPKHISAVGYAHTKPVASNDSADGRHRNRRVEIYVTPIK